MTQKAPDIIHSASGLVADVRSMIEQTREGVAQTVNAGITLLYWRIGKRIQTAVLDNERAEYGKEIVATLSRQLMDEFGRGFSRRNLFNMIRFAEVFPNGQIVHSLSAQLGWTHFRDIIPLQDSLQREFYAEMCRVERWSTRTLRAKIQSMLYERTAISKKPEEVAKAELAALREEDKLSPDLIFRDPYVLDFLGLKDRYLEKDRTNRAARTRPIGHPRRGIPDRSPLPRSPPTKTPRRHRALPRPLRAKRRPVMTPIPIISPVDYPPAVKLESAGGEHRSVSARLNLERVEMVGRPCLQTSFPPIKHP